jgi:ankyrin repeat protein
MSLDDDFERSGSRGRNERLSDKLVTAALERDFPAMRELLRKGADPDCEVPDFGPLLIFAVRQGDAKLAERLAEAGAAIDKPDESGRTALMWAAHYGLIDIAVGLLEHGADPLRRNEAGVSARALAADAAAAFAQGAEENITSIEDIEVIAARFERMKALLEREEERARAARDPEIFHEGLCRPLAVRAPFKFRPRE